MEWAGQGGSCPGIILGSLDNYIGVTEENHDNQLVATLLSQSHFNKPVTNCINSMRRRRGGGQLPPNFIDTLSNVLRALPFSQNQPQQSVDDWYSRILKNKIKITGCLDEIRKSDLICDLNYVTESRNMQSYVHAHKCSCKFLTQFPKSNLNYSIAISLSPPLSKEKFLEHASLHGAEFWLRSSIRDKRPP
jgi:hypothetical protein